MALSPDVRARFERAGDAGKAALAGIAKQVPEEIGPMVAWLCSDEAANINGRTFLVRAGFIGLYSEPEIVGSITSEEPWTVDNISSRVSSVTASLTNEWPAQPPKE
jgi:hypothetical protein